MTMLGTKAVKEERADDFPDHFEEEEEEKKNMVEKSESSAESENKNESGGNNSTVCLWFESFDAISVYALDTSTLSLDHVVDLCHESSPWQKGYTELGSKLYVLGGDYLKGETGFQYPREVLICDLSKKTGWERGPCLKGGKPKSLVLAVNGKIYALAGSTSRVEFGIPEPPFEVLDPESEEGWAALPNPPFYSQYNHHLGFEFIAHTVVGSTIYIRVWTPNGKDGLYSFDVIKQEWEEPLDTWRKNPVAENLMACKKWDSRGDVADKKLYQFDAERAHVYAYDLAANAVENRRFGFVCDEELDLSKSPLTLMFDDFKGSYCEIVPVLGLDDVMDLLPLDENSSGFVTHLGGQTFCLVAYSLPLSDDPDAPNHDLCVCTFQIQMVKDGDHRERFGLLCAQNVRHRFHVLHGESTARPFYCSRL